MKYKYNPPYSLFQGPDGRWGTKNKDGKIQFKPIYLRSIVPGKENFFHDETGLDVVEFNPETGMSLVVWCSEPWYDNAWCIAHYPERYDDYLWQNINAKPNLGIKDIETLEQISSKVNLTQQQKELFELLRLFLEFEDEDIDDNRWDELEQVILAHNIIKLTADKRMELILPLMESSELTEDEKSILWYTLFRLNDYISCQ